jgi:hypothetical protein
LEQKREKNGGKTNGSLSTGYTAAMEAVDDDEEEIEFTEQEEEKEHQFIMSI